MSLRVRRSIGMALLLSLPLLFLGPGSIATAAPVPGASPDFDGDGRPDLVIGGIDAVEIDYGSGRQQTLTHDDLAVDNPYALGNHLLARDFNRDGHADLALPDRYAKVLVMVFGGPKGLDVDTLHRTPAPAGVGGFGFSIALLTKPTPLLVVGGGLVDGSGGVVFGFPLGADGRPDRAAFWISQDSPGIPGKDERAVGDQEAGDLFGGSLAAEGSTLVVGNPWEDVGTIWNAGSIVVLTYKGGKSFSGVGITQNSRGVVGKARHGVQFGRNIAIGHGYIAVGLPDERKDAGAVQLFTAAAKPKPLYVIDQNSSGVPGGNETGDAFGSSVVVARLCDGRVGLVVGGLGEEVGAGTGAFWAIPLKRTKTCPARMIVEGPGEILGGNRVEWGGLLGSAATTMRAPTTKADTLVLAGQGTESFVNSRVYLVPSSYSTGSVAYTGPGRAEGLGLSPPG